MGAIITLDDADSIADLVLKEARLDGLEAPPVRLLAKRWGAEVRIVPRRLWRWGRHAAWVRLGRGFRVYVRSDIADPFSIAHELGHVAIHRWGLRVELDEERWCNRFAAALLAPAVAVRRAWRGAFVGLFERWPHVPQTAIAMRIAEAHCAPIWILEGRRVRYALGPFMPRDVLDVANDAVRDGTASRGELVAMRLEDGHRRAVVAA